MSADLFVADTGEADLPAVVCLHSLFLDHTMFDAFTAAAALDAPSPRWLRIASFQLSPRELAAAAAAAATVSGESPEVMT